MNGIEDLHESADGELFLTEEETVKHNEEINGLSEPALDQAQKAGSIKTAVEVINETLGQGETVTFEAVQELLAKRGVNITEEDYNLVTEVIASTPKKVAAAPEPKKSFFSGLFGRR